MGPTYTHFCLKRNIYQTIFVFFLKLLRRTSTEATCSASPAVHYDIPACIETIISNEML